MLHAGAIALCATVLRPLRARAQAATSISTTDLGGGLFLFQAFAMARDGTDGRAVRVYRYSITYLAALFGLIILDVAVFLPLA